MRRHKPPPRPPAIASPSSLDLAPGAAARPRLRLAAKRTRDGYYLISFSYFGSTFTGAASLTVTTTSTITFFGGRHEFLTHTEIVTGTEIVTLPGLVFGWT